jgi:hypothetical protein
VGGGGVARLAGVDDDHRPPLPPELERSGEAGGRSTNDGDVALALDGVGRVFGHGSHDTLSLLRCKTFCGIRKNRTERPEWLS